MIYWSPTNRGFYDFALHGDPGSVGCKVAPDAVEITDAAYEALMAAQANGQMITAGEDGEPIALDRPGPTEEQLWADHQAAAKLALSDSDITIVRCFEHGVAVPSDWVDYRAALRAIVSASSGDPTAALPIKPAYPADT